MKLIFDSKYFLCALICFLSESALAMPLSIQEKQEYIKGAIPSCFSKQSLNRKMNQQEKAGLSAYCECHANKMSKSLTREEMSQLSKGVLPNSLPPKVKEAQSSCIETLSK